MYPTHCPHCSACLEGEDILEVMKRVYPNDLERAEDAASAYGWTRKNRVKFNRVLGRYHLEADRIMEWECPDCLKSWER